MLRKYKWMYLLYAVACVALCQFAIRPWLGIWGCLIAVVILLPIGYFAAVKLSVKEFDRAHELLQDCHAGDCKIILNSIIDANKSGKEVIYSSLLSIAICEFYLGNFDKALEILNGLKEKGLNWYQLYEWCYCVYRESDQLEKAEEELGKMEVLLTSLVNEHPTEAKGLEQTIAAYKKNISLRQGDKQEYYNEMQRQLMSASSMLNKMSVCQRIAQICYDMGNFEEAKLYCEFVIANGGDTFYVARMKELLRKM